MTLEELEIYLQEKYKKSFNDIKIVLEYKGNDASYYKVFTEFIFVANSLLASKEIMFCFSSVEELEIRLENHINYIKEQSSIYTTEDLRDIYKSLKEHLSSEEYESYKLKENEKEIYLIIGNEEIIINKKDNTVKSSMNNFNSIHEIVGELINR